jgi:hypothetical protein
MLNLGVIAVFILAHCANAAHTGQAIGEILGIPNEADKRLHELRDYGLLANNYLFI